MSEFKSIYESSKLPKEWDKLADNYFQQTTFLSHAEKFNPCQQRYYILIENSKLAAAAIVYSIRIDLLTFVTLKSPVKMHVVGIPCSVSSPGIFGESRALEVLKEHISSREKGFLLYLNLKNKPNNRSYASGKTLPTMVIQNQFANWEAYKASFRSHYRRRLNQINRENNELHIEKMTCSNFNGEMYSQYVDVYKRSKGKLEKLPFEFFKFLPADFTLTVCYRNTAIIGWNIALEDKDHYYFFLGGIDYRHNLQYNTYLRLMSTLIKDGIDRGVAFVELGQTAEIPKMRMGGKPRILYMEAHHSSAIFNAVIKRFSGLLEYRSRLEQGNVLKEERL